MNSFAKIFLRKTFLIINTANITYRFYKNYKINSQRKHEIDLKCKSIIKKNPEILHYFGSINDLSLTNLYEFPLKDPKLEILNNVEYLIDGTKRMGKVSIRYYLIDSTKLIEIVEMQKENLQNLLKMQKIYESNPAEKIINGFNMKNLLRGNSYKYEINKTNYDNSNNINSNIMELASGEINKKRNSLHFDKDFNFYYESQVDSLIHLNNLNNSKLNELEKFYNEYQKFLLVKFNNKNRSILDKNEDSKKEKNKEIIIPIFNYLLNYLETKANADSKLDIIIDDIYIKKNFKYYSINPQKYDSEEYKRENTSMIFNIKQKESASKENENINILKITSSFLKERKIIQQYKNLFNNRQNKIIDKSKTDEDNDYEYNYPFIEELYDYTHLDWRISYVLYCTIFSTIFLTLYSYSFGHINLEKFDKIVKYYMKMNKGKITIFNEPFIYNVRRSPNFIFSDRHKVFILVQPLNSNKFIKITKLLLKGKGFDIGEITITDDYPKI